MLTTFYFLYSQTLGWKINGVSFRYTQFSQYILLNDWNLVDDGLADHGEAVVVAVDVPVVHEQNWIPVDDYLKIEERKWRRPLENNWSKIKLKNIDCCNLILIYNSPKNCQSNITWIKPRTLCHLKVKMLSPELTLTLCSYKPIKYLEREDPWVWCNKSQNLPTNESSWLEMLDPLCNYLHLEIL